MGPRRPEIRLGKIVLMGFLAAEALLLTGTWQLAYLAGFVAGLLAPGGGRGALLGALSVATAWAAYLVYVFAFGFGLQLADLIGAILGAGPGAWWLLTVLTILLALLLGATGGFTGQVFAELLFWSKECGGTMGS